MTATFFFVATSVLAQTPPVPNTPIGARFERFLTDYNAGAPADPRIARWYSIFGPLSDDVVVERSEPDSLRVWARGTITEAWLGFEINAAPLGAPEPPVVVLQLAGDLPPNVENPHRPDRQRLDQRLRRYLRRLEAADLFSGAVLVARNDRIVFEHAGGMASRRYLAANDEATMFSIASVGKVFTATAILQLADSGRLSLDDEVDRYLPDYPDARTRSATIRQLLNHMSGVGRSALDWIADRHARSLTELITLTTSASAFEPGSDVQYSNEAYLLAGRIIEIASGQDYDTYLRDNIFIPTGMTRTGRFRWDEELSNVATPYSNWQMTIDGGQEFVPGPRRNALMLQGLRGSPAGGSFSTARDLFAFSQALTHGRFLSAPLLQEMRTAARPAPPPFRSFGLGLEIGLSGTQQWFGKSGGAQGVSAQWCVMPETGYTVIVLSNYDMAANIVASRIVEWIAHP